MTTGTKLKRARPKKLSEFASRLLVEWRRLELPASDATIILAVSGGADSCALLLALDELICAGKLKIQLVVAHLDHRLRKGSREDAAWVSQIAAKLDHRFVGASANIQKRAKETADNLEQSARRARYEFFAKTAASVKARVVLTAHTLDDQAETILMRLLRGSGAEGLGGTEITRPLSPGSEVTVARPLLSWARRAETELYCRGRRVRFRVDEMNEDERFLRVKVRKQLVPLMGTMNGRIVETLARTSNLLRDDASALNELAKELLAEARPEEAAKAPKGPVNVAVLRAAPPAIRRRALRLWIHENVGHLRRLEQVHVLAVEKLFEGNRGKLAELPGGIKIERKRGRLYLTVGRGEKS